MKELDKGKEMNITNKSNDKELNDMKVELNKMNSKVRGDKEIMIGKKMKRLKAKGKEEKERKVLTL